MLPTLKQKVAHLTSVHNPADTRIAYRECFTLAQAGYEVVLIGTGDAPALPQGIRYVGIATPRNRFERMTRTIWCVYRAALREKADVYHFHDPELMGVGLALRARGSKVVFDVHEDIPQDIMENKPWIPAPLRRPVSCAAEIALRFLQRGYSAIVAATPTVARRFPHRHIVVVCNYPRIEELPQSGAPAFADRPRAVVYLGSITQERGIDELVSAMDSPLLGADTHLLLAGTFDGDEEYARVGAMPGFRKVEYLGYCPRSQVASVLGRARAGLAVFRPAANHDEAIPTKVFEYLGSGLPVIISQTQRYSSLVREHECGIVVNALDVAAISRAIAYLTDNPEIAQAMGERGRRLVMERYEWSSEATKLTRLYAEIA